MNNVAHELGLDDGEPLDEQKMRQETVAPVPEETLLPSMPQAEEQAAPESTPESEPVEASQEQADIDLVEEKQESPAQKRIRQEIDRRKELQGQLDQQREQIALMEQRFQALMQRANTEAQPESEQVPDFDDDPAAHLLAQQQKLQQQVAQQNAFLQRQQAEQQRQAQITQMVNTYTPMEEKFASEHEEYYPRVEALKTQRMQMYQAMGKSEAEASQMVMNEAMSLVHQSLAAGRNPAEIIYQYATATPQPAAPAPQATPAPQQAAPVPSRLGTRGSTPRAPTAYDLSTMSDEEFDRATAGENWRRLMTAL